MKIVLFNISSTKDLHSMNSKFSFGAKVGDVYCNELIWTEPMWKDNDQWSPIRYVPLKMINLVKAR